MSTHNDLDPSVFTFLEETFKGEEVQAVPLAGDASARRYYRVIQNDESQVLMQWEPFDKEPNYPFLSVLGLFKDAGVLVPKVINYDASKGFILLEDLGDLTLERKFWENQDQSLIVPDYKLAIDELIKIHYKTDSPSHPGCPAFAIEFDSEKLLWEMNYGRKHLIEDLCAVNLSTAESKALDDVFTSICDRLAAEPKVVCHRDYHSRNLMLKLGKMRVIDFQDARFGPIQYDLVSLVHDSYVRLEPGIRAEILNYYVTEANKLKSDPLNKDHFNDIMDLQVIQRCFKACGSFASFYNLRQDTRYLKYISSTITKVAGYVKRYDKYQAFSEILGNKGILEREYLKQ